MRNKKCKHKMKELYYISIILEDTLFNVTSFSFPPDTNVQTFSLVWLLFTGAFTFSEPVPITTHSPGTSVLQTADIAQQVRLSLNRLHSITNKAHHSYVSTKLTLFTQFSNGLEFYFSNKSDPKTLWLV